MYREKKLKVGLSVLFGLLPRRYPRVLELDVQLQVRSVRSLSLAADVLWSQRANADRASIYLLGFYGFSLFSLFSFLSFLSLKLILPLNSCCWVCRGTVLRPHQWQWWSAALPPMSSTQVVDSQALGWSFPFVKSCSVQRTKPVAQLYCLTSAIRLIMTPSLNYIDCRNSIASGHLFSIAATNCEVDFVCLFSFCLEEVYCHAGAAMEIV